MFIYSTVLALLPLTLAAPVTQHFAPIRRAVDVGGRSAKDNGYIVAIKANTVDPNNRGAWLNKVLSTAGVELDDAAQADLKLKWSPDIMNGLAGSFSAKAIKVLQTQPEVAWIQEDIQMHTTAVLQQSNAGWGLARLSTAQSLTGKDPLQLNFGYAFDDKAGAGTRAFVLDTGCRVTHKDYGGRAKFVQTFGTGVPGQDKNGHGTHVSGTIMGSVFGVAKSAEVDCIKVMADDGSGATSDIISGINLAAQLFAADNKPSVASMSLGGPVNQAIDTAVANAIAQGLPFVVAAGNESQDANNVSPARLADAITVGATTIDDTFASFSNDGSQVDILAPGQDILSAGFQDDTAVANLSGTSMATPHISGLSLTLMAIEGRQLTPAELKTRLIQLAGANKIQQVPGGTTNELAGNGLQAVAN